jgi:hypothetical protein
MGLIGNSSRMPPRGSGGVVLRAPGYGGDVIGGGGLLAIGIARITVTPLVTGGHDTHTQYGSKK